MAEYAKSMYLFLLSFVAVGFQSKLILLTNGKVEHSKCPRIFRQIFTKVKKIDIVFIIRQLFCS